MAYSRTWKSRPRTSPLSVHRLARTNRKLKKKKTEKTKMKMKMALWRKKRAMKT
jgi:hypothetical protein